LLEILDVLNTILLSFDLISDVIWTHL